MGPPPPGTAVAAASAVAVESRTLALDAELDDTPEADRLDAVIEATPTPGRAPTAASPAGRAEAPVPSRLAVPAWLHALATAADRRGVRVALAEGGSVRLDTARDADAVTVRVQFSDPELQALAGAHASRIRDALETHFAEPVRLQLTDAGTQAGGHPGGDRPAERGAPRDASPTDSSAGTPDASTPTSSDARPATGRREWIG